MSLEAWGDEGPDYGWSDERVDEIGFGSFLAGVRMCREMMARFVEQGGDKATAESIRANWNPNWGANLPRPTDQEYDRAMQSFDWSDWV